MLEVERVGRALEEAVGLTSTLELAELEAG